MSGFIVTRNYMSFIKAVMGNYLKLLFNYISFYGNGTPVVAVAIIVRRIPFLITDASSL